MTDIRDLLHRAAESESEWTVDRQALVTAGRRRVARRRFAAIGCAVAVAATVTVVGLTTLAGRDDPQSLITDNDRGAGLYSEVRVPVAEVERRCTLVLNAQSGSGDSDVQWVAGTDSAGRGVSAAATGQAVEDREGHSVPVIPAGDPWPEIHDGSPHSAGGVGPNTDRSADCVIPQESMLEQLDTSVPGSVPAADDHRAVLADCSTHTGYDIRSWSVLAAVDGVGYLEAVTMSDNGYVVTCSIDPGGVTLSFDDHRYLDDLGLPSLPSDDQGPADPDRYPAPGSPTCQGTDQGPVECTITGVLPGLPDGYQIALTLPDGAVATTSTHGGAFATAFETAAFPDRFPVEVSTADGDVLWRGRW